MKKTITLSLLLAIVLLMGCTQNEEKTTTADGVKITLSLGTNQVRQGRQTTLNVKVNNNYPENLENAVLKIIAPSDIEVLGGGIKTDLQIPKGGTEFPTSWTLKVNDNAIKRDYQIKARLCFDYNSTGYQDLIYSSTKTTTKPQSGSTKGPVTVTVSGAENGYDITSNNEAYLLVTATNTNNGKIQYAYDDTRELINFEITIRDPNIHLYVIDNLLATDLLGYEYAEDGDIKIYSKGEGYPADNGMAQVSLPIGICDEEAASNGLCQIVEGESISTVNARAEYTYCIDSDSITLTVN